MHPQQQSNTTRFLSAPPSISATVAALIEPALAGGLWLGLHRGMGLPIEGQTVATLLLVLVMLFPGANRLGRVGISVGIDIFLSWLSVVAVLLLLGYATRGYHHFHRPLVVAWVLLTPLAQWLVTRAITAAMLWIVKRPHRLRRAVVVGGGPMGQRVSEMLAQRTGWQLLGVFDDRAEPREVRGHAVVNLGGVAKLPQYIDDEQVADVFITLPMSSQPRIVQLMESLQNTTASLHYVPDVFAANVIQGRFEDMGGLPVVSLHITPFTGVNRVLKRVSDVVLSAIILVLITPVLAGVALGVRLSSPGPIIFKQRRTGLDGETIWVYKFRSMTVTDDGAVVKQATKGDARVTPFGAFIRKTSLDELPQFVNVLQGRMSIVGPRPHALAHNDHYRALVKAYMARHKVKPGITGWAQVNGYRGETDTIDKMERRVEYDLDYLRNWSLGLDLLIIARTVKQVFFNRGVY